MKILVDENMPYARELFSRLGEVKAVAGRPVPVDALNDADALMVRSVTKVNEALLSGGQKQRISIARALLLEAEILILDDALSAVDGRTEHQILHNLRQWGEGRTVIISAHRLSALTEASEILVMQHGHIAQRGRHEALAAQPGWYRDMYRYQQLEAALDDVPQEDEEVAGA